MYASDGSRVTISDGLIANNVAEERAAAVSPTALQSVPKAFLSCVHTYMELAWNLWTGHGPCSVFPAA